MHTGLRRLHYFVGLARDLNFRRTAVRLGITQPALSRAIALLERDVGTALFDRGRGGVSLTPAGRAFESGARGVPEALAAAVPQARRIAAGRAGQLAIGYTDTAVCGCLPDLVQGFRTAYPDVVVQLRQGYTREQRRWLEEGRLDVAFMTGPVTGDAHGAITVQTDPFVAVLPVAHRLAARESLRLADLADEPFVLGDPDRWSIYNEHLSRLCAAAGFAPRTVQTAPDSRGILGLVSCGMGVSVQTGSLVRDGDRRVAVRPLEDCTERLITQAVWNARLESPPRRRLIGFIEDAVADGAVRAGPSAPPPNGDGDGDRSRA